jgi:hypothetical protein
VTYQRLAEDAERPPKRLRDHTATWNQLEPASAANGSVTAFCARKGISVAALEALGARIAVRNGQVCLAFAGTNGNGVVTAIKYRPVDGSSHDSTAEKSSVWLRPLVIGNMASRDWFIVEGETDAARIHGLAGDAVAIVVLPAGARTFKRGWADPIPRGARVFLALDNDDDGDAGAEKIASILGGSVRVRPPDGVNDWCDWDGDREAFIELVNTTAATAERSFVFQPMHEFVAHEYPPAEPLLGYPARSGWASAR